MSNEQIEEMKKAYATLISLKNNLPTDLMIDEKYVQLFHSEIDKLVKLGCHLEDFKVPSEEISPRLTSVSSRGKKYSSKSFVDRSMILIKLDSILSFIRVLPEEVEIGFCQD